MCSERPGRRGATSPGWGKRGGPTCAHGPDGGAPHRPDGASAKGRRAASGPDGGAPHRPDGASAEGRCARMAGISARAHARPTFVPCFCSEKSARSTQTASADRTRSDPTGSPSSAPNTLMAGVMAPSPSSRLQPSIARSVTRCRARAPSGGPERIVCRSANVPPSPWWLTRITHPTYLPHTTRVSAQKIIEKVPRMSAGCGSACSSVV